MRAVRLYVGVAVLGLVAAVSAVPASAGSPVPDRAPVAARQAAEPWKPPAGVLLSNPQSRNSRVILSRVINTVNHMARGRTIRIAVWNFDDGPTREALIRADKRGVNVKVVVAGSVSNRNWTALAKQLNRRTGDASYARRCQGGCRSYSKIMHSKVFLFSRVGQQEGISMYGSANLTTPAGNRQWNDMVTTYTWPLYKAFYKLFEEYAADRAVKPIYARTDVNKSFSMWTWPSGKHNTILEQLRQVQCTGALGMPGGRTKIRIAIAGWFDAFGTDIARRVRTLWNSGCDIRIVTTLAGRGVNQVLKAGYGRGPVPIDRIGVDPNNDGVPDKYLHMKAVAIKGVFDGNRRARVLITGSPNWSTRASRSDEVLIRWKTPGSGVVDAYIRHIDNLYTGPWSYARTGTTARTGADPLLRSVTDPDAPALPAWFELD